VFRKPIQAHVLAALADTQCLIVRGRTRPTQPEPTQFVCDRALAPR
jgi:hypothetical protein